MQPTSLDSIGLFEGMSTEEKQDLVSRFRYMQLRRGQVLFNVDEENDHVFFILEGKIKVCHQAPDGRENLLMVLGKGDCLGVLSLFYPGPSTTSATAISGVTLASLPAQEFTKRLSTSPVVSRQLTKEIAWRLHKSNSIIAGLVFSDVPGRVARTLLDLAERFGVQTAEGVRVPHDLTQEELAQAVGASRETVNKALAEFVDRGWIRLEVRAVTLLDYDRLSKRAV